MFKFRNYKQHYIQNLTLAAPVVLSQIGQVVVQLVDNAMVGQLGALPLAAVSFGGTVFFILFIFVMGITMGLTPLVGECYARGRHKESASYLQNAIVLYSITGVLAFGVQQLMIPLMPLLGQPEAVVEMAIPYYNFLVWSIIPFMLFAAFKQFLEGVGNTTVSMFVIITANLINVLGNYLFIYGNWGFPAMGAAGAGLSTLIARICMPLFIVSYFFYKERFRRYLNMFSWPRFDRRYIKSLLEVGFPISMQMVMEASAFCFTAIMVGWIGTNEISGNQIATVISNFAFMMVLGIAAATTIRVSHEFGAGNLKQMSRAATASFHITIVWNLITAILFVSFRHYIPLIFTSDPAVIEVASTLLLFVAVFQLSDGLQCIAIGVLRGMKDVKSVMVIAFFSYIVINLPVGYVCAFVFGWGAPGLWVGFICGLTIAATLLIRRYLKLYKHLKTQTLLVENR